MNRPVRKNQDLHGNAPDSCPAVFLLVDVLNDLDFPGNSRLLKSMQKLGKNISVLKRAMQVRPYSRHLCERQSR
jgi:hypothetical protein